MNKPRLRLFHLIPGGFQWICALPITKNQPYHNDWPGFGNTVTAAYEMWKRLNSRLIIWDFTNDSH